MLDVTFRGIEETAAKILKILNDRSGYASPQWVEEMHRKEAAAQAAARAQATVPLSSSSDDEAGPAAPAPPRPVVGERLSTVISEYVYSGDNYLMQGLY